MSQHQWLDDSDRCSCGHLGMFHYGGGEYFETGCSECDKNQEEKIISNHPQFWKYTFILSIQVWALGFFCGILFIIGGN